jgi:hypothetical protein
VIRRVLDPLPSNIITSPAGGTPMKRFTLLTGFLILTTAVAIPLWFMRKGKALRLETEENIRYDINDYMATEGL